MSILRGLLHLVLPVPGDLGDAKLHGSTAERVPLECAIPCSAGRTS